MFCTELGTISAATAISYCQFSLQDAKEIRDVLNAVAIVSALLATLTYTGVLTPPQQVSDCTDLCGNPTLSNIGVTVWYAVRAATKADNGSAIFRNTTQSYFGGLYNTSRVVNSKTVFIPSTTAFIAFNAAALYLSLAALTQTLLLIWWTSSPKPGAVASKALINCLRCILFEVIFAIVCASVSFTVAHYTVFYVDGDKHQGFWAAVSVGILMFVITVVVPFVVCYCRCWAFETPIIIPPTKVKFVDADVKLLVGTIVATVVETLSTTHGDEVSRFVATVVEPLGRQLQPQLRQVVATALVAAAREVGLALGTD